MIQSLYELGVALASDQRYAEYFSSYEDPFAAGKKKGDDIVLYFPVDKEGVVGKMDFASYNPSQAGRYLYRKPAGANAAPLVASGPFYPESDLEDEKKRKKHEDGVAKIMKRLARTIPEGTSVYFPDNAKRTAGLAGVAEQLNAFVGTTGNRYLYTFRVDGQWLGEIAELRELLDAEASAKYHNKSKAKDKTCALTRTAGKEVWGRVDTLGFTVNERAFNRGGFDPKTSYRMFPVSADATHKLEAAKRFAFTKLSAWFHPLEYLMIPRNVAGTPDQVLSAIQIMTRIREENGLEGQIEKALLPSNRMLEYITEKEELSANGQLYDLLFFHRNQAQLGLDLYLQDINPGRISSMVTAKKAVNKYYGAAFASGKRDDPKFFHFTLATPKVFFVEGFGANIRLHGTFYRMLEAIFYGEAFPRGVLLERFMHTLRKGFKNRNEAPYWFFDCYRAIALLRYLDHLHQLQTQLHAPMDTPAPPSQSSEMPRTIKGYLADHADYYREDKPALRGAFLVGILTGMLTYAQYKAINSKPFLNRLNNLSLNLHELQALLPKVYDKILAYQDRTATKKLLPYGLVTELMADASDYLTRAGEASTKISRDETSFAFTSGLVLQQKLGLEIAAKAKAAAEAE